MSLPQCTEGQQPWNLLYGAPDGPYTADGATAQSACNNWFASNAAGGWTLSSFSGGLCTLSHSTYGEDYGYTVQVCASDAEPETPEPSPQLRIDAIDGHVVVTVAVGTQSIEVKPEPLNAERVEDMGTLFLLFLAAGVVIYCARELANLFRVDSTRD